MSETKLPFMGEVIGQPEAISTIRRSLRLRQLSDEGCVQPMAFVFLGPEGCGKSFAADQLAHMGDVQRPVLRIPMGTYQNDNEAAGLVGLRPIYTSARPGMLTSFVREKPQALVVFEDIDRAHPNVQDVLAPMLARGVLVDQCGFYEGDPKRGVLKAPPEVDFSQTLIIFTTSLGRKLYDDEAWLAQMAQKPGLINSILVQEVAAVTSDHFSDNLPAVGRSLMSEFGKLEWVLFRRLRLEALLQIAGRQFESLDQMVRRAGYTGLQLGDGSDAVRRQLLTAVVLANGPEPKPAMLEASDLARTYLEPVLELAEPGHGTLTVDLAPAAKDNLEAALADLGDQPLRNLFRKNWLLSCHSRAEPRVESGLAVIIEGCELARVPERRDFGGIGGLTVGLPEQRFADIAGHVEAKRRLKEVIGMLHAPERLAQWAVEAPRGMLLWGPPGTGKTMLARAFACEADLPFIATTGSELLDPQRISQVFDLARKYAPAAVFIDEIDALGRRDNGGATYAINQLLAELDGFDGQSEGRLFVIAASNLPDRIDSAIVRSGRLDLHIHIPPLDSAARGYFIDRLRSMAKLPKKDWQRIVELSAGMTGADLEKLRREIAYDLLRRRKARASRDDIVEHINTLKYGVRDTRERTREEQEHVAYHEAGHILLSQLLNPEVKINHVSLTPRGRTEGFVEYDTESFNQRRMTKKEVKEQLTILMGGRAAQIVKFGEDGIDAGAADDLAKARSLARQGVESWGMGEHLFSCAANELETWLSDALLAAQTLLAEHQEGLELIVMRLRSGSAGN